MLDEQMRDAGDPELQRLLKRIRLGVQDRTDLDLNSRCYREDRRTPWETGITVVTPLNRNRWNLNMEATLAFRVQQRSMMRIFMSEHRWKEELPTEEEAITMLNQATIARSRCRPSSCSWPGRRHHARVQGAGDRPSGQPGPRGDDCRAGQARGTEREDC
ncbi:hypothetical protein HIM_12552 [Hirsutella minnesotensis 3608]|uniref:Uncharacterized protein n=1 Tax=Hirsutella minnesotensis 3608 TaxID=1043627 RepID=A0A0F7ZVZ0_9HYPO|nr:hypothetical protein HIM_12552 [Hirsutella minnesotensis 3608]